MKITGVRLEIDAALSPDEIDLLGKADLIGKAHIWDEKERRRDVPIVLSTYIEPRMQYAARMNGCYWHAEGFKYIPHASRIFFHLGGEMYSELQRRGFCVSRFNSGGKIKLFDSTRKSEVYM